MGRCACRRSPGRPGPLYHLGDGGSHSTHLCRILGLSSIFARVSHPPLPRLVLNGGGPFRRVERTQLDEQADLWAALHRTGLVRGQLRRHGSIAELALDHVAALWWLLPADLAVLYNQRYERLHPGRLREAGVPDDAVYDAERWRRWLLG